GRGPPIADIAISAAQLHRQPDLPGRSVVTASVARSASRSRSRSRMRCLPPRISLRHLVEERRRGVALPRVQGNRVRAVAEASSAAIAAAVERRLTHESIMDNLIEVLRAREIGM